ncbi:MAG: hypothetical protein L6R28_21315 [Planctomycetes bacterium]|nr:hypothetical protein [Planctomycetota bacterium]
MHENADGTNNSFTRPEPDLASPPGIERAVRELEARLRAIRGERARLQREHAESRERFTGACKDALRLARAAAETERARIQREAGVKTAAIKKHAQARLARVDRAFSAELNRTRSELHQETERIEKVLTAEREAILRANNQAHEELSRRAEAIGARIEALRTLAGSINRGAEELSAECAIRPSVDAPPAAPPPFPEGLDTLAALDECAARLDQDSARLHALQRSRWTFFARRGTFWLGLLGLIAAHSLAALFREPLAGALHFGTVPFVMAASVSLAVTLAAWIQLAGAGRVRVAQGTAALRGGTDAAYDRLEIAELETQAWLQRSHDEHLEARIEHVLGAEHTGVRELEDRRRDGSLAQAALQARYTALRARIGMKRDAAVRVQESLAQGEAARTSAVHEEKLRALQESQAAELAAMEAQANSAVAAQEGRWRAELDLFAASGDRALSARAVEHPAWAEMAANGYRLPEGFPAHAPLGRLHVRLEQLKTGEGDERLLFSDDREAALPFDLAFPQRGHLVVHAPPACRDAALAMLYGTVLRLFACFPPGKAKFTFVDAAALGKSFSALRPLADRDESLVGPRIWTEPSHIEKRVSELTEHVEKVIQKYLRDAYPTIAEYNREAGALQEAYRFLVVSDFPAGFTDLAMERLAALFKSGAACGVHVLMLHDDRQRLPAGLDAATLKREAVVMHAKPGGWMPAHGDLARWRFEPEPAPPPQEIPKVLDAVGRQAQAAARVELDFALVAPEESQRWTRSAAESFRVPIGRSGLERTQELELGKGTAQHALVAGRTGSGKSTLFHVMISCAALWYGPDEVEFYLIDFKKGVEFKAYARHRLPHARVVAMESDREFGLSVLRRIDAELTRRGERFRAAGVQDLAGFRRRCPDERMPRTLLMVDEFQEFFTEDDEVGRDAALLLDRFVRQGRAFGMHAVLGSQTLSGVYSLAKSTLGQMGVRIALQCNEADSYLILSEDNAAARLLARPGEAIYNDQSGLIEGNNPFQVVWLNEGTQAAYLEPLPSRAEREGKAPETPGIVFEGNAPADLANNAELCARLEVRDTEGTETPLCRAWLGEPNAIKGPTAVHFHSEGGGNLLMVGPRRDSAFSLSVAAMLSLAAEFPAGGVRMVFLNGLGAFPEVEEELARVRAALPHELEIVNYADVGAAVERLDAQRAARHAGEEAPNVPVFLFVFGLQRLRMLKGEDEFSFSKSDAAAPGERFLELLRTGPEVRMHTVLWCDTPQNLTRALGRRTLGEFNDRILFQLSAADSSELIDSPAANRLGLYNALLSVERDGLLEKFRPYGLPDAGFLERFRTRSPAPRSVKA